MFRKADLERLIRQAREMGLDKDPSFQDSMRSLYAATKTGIELLNTVEQLLHKYPGRPATPYKEQMLQDVHVAEKYLAHNDPSVRCDALDALESFHGSSQDVMRVCEERALEDPDPAVRGVAIGKLVRLSLRQKDLSRALVLALIVRRESETVVNRLDAYFGLFDVAGRPLTEIPVSLVSEFPKGVDWEFVNGFAEGGGGKGERGKA